MHFLPNSRFFLISENTAPRVFLQIKNVILNFKLDSIQDSIVRIIKVLMKVVFPSVIKICKSIFFISQSFLKSFSFLRVTVNLQNFLKNSLFFHVRFCGALWLIEPTFRKAKRSVGQWVHLRFFNYFRHHDV